MAMMKRCRAQLNLAGRWGTEYLWPGLEVNFARELAPGFTVADAVAGREDCFDDVDPPSDGDPASTDNSQTTNPKKRTARGQAESPAVQE